MTGPAYPVPAADMASAGLSLATEFPAWQAAVSPGGLGVWTAYWQSEDGRHRRYIVAPSGPQLLGALRARAAEDTPARRSDGLSLPRPHARTYRARQGSACPDALQGSQGRKPGCPASCQPIAPAERTTADGQPATR
jgi:hypothetical protein